MMRGPVLIALVIAMASMCVASWPAHGQSQTEIIPSINVSESYDTNVLFSNNRSAADFITTIAPVVNVIRRSRLVDLNGSFTVSGNLYARNPGLNYISTTAGINASLDNLMNQFVKRATLSVNDYFTYTPQPPAFYAPPVGGSTTAGPENFIRGIQAVRANSLINVFGVNSSYVLDKTTSIIGSINHQYMRFGSAFAPTTGGGFFNTQFLTLSAGPQFTVTTKDKVTVNLNYSAAYYIGSSFQLAGGTVGWQRQLSQKISFNVNGGLTRFLGGTESLLYVGSGLLTWQERSTVTTLSVSRSVFPSFYVTSTALVSNVVSLSVNRQFTERLTGSVSANYAQNESVSGPSLNFTSYFGSLSLNYFLTKRLITTASYSRFQSNSTFVGQDIGFNRDIATLTLRYEWR